MRGVLRKWIKLLTTPREKANTSKPFLDEWQLATRENVSEVAQAYQKRYQDALADHYKSVAKTHADTRKKLEAGDPVKESIKADGKDLFYNAVFAQNGP